MIINDEYEVACKKYRKMYDEVEKAIKERNFVKCAELQPHLDILEFEVNRLYEKYEEPEPPKVHIDIFVFMVYSKDYSVIETYSNLDSNNFEITFEYNGESVTGSPRKVAKFARKHGLIAHMFISNAWYDFSSNDVLW